MATTTTPGATFSKLGPGTLKLGATGSEIEFASRTTKTELAPELKDEDEVGLLSGDAYKPEGKVEGSLTGTFYQEYGSDSLLKWTYDNAGKTVPFTFIPNTTDGMTFKGSCQVKPVKVGGDPKKTNTTDFDFPLVGGLPAITVTPKV